MTGDGRLIIINQRGLQNKYIERSVTPMATVKMGMTIEEAAECSGIGRNTMRKLVEWRKLPVLKVGRQDHHPQRHAGAVHDRQPGTESAGQGRCAGRGVMRASQKCVSGATPPQGLAVCERKYTHRTNLRFVLCVFRPAGGCRRWRGGAV